MAHHGFGRPRSPKWGRGAIGRGGCCGRASFLDALAVLEAWRREVRRVDADALSIPSVSPPAAGPLVLSGCRRGGHFDDSRSGFRNSNGLCSCATRILFRAAQGCRCGFGRAGAVSRWILEWSAAPRRRPNPPGVLIGLARSHGPLAFGGRALLPITLSSDVRRVEGHSPAVRMFQSQIERASGSSGARGRGGGVGPFFTVRALVEQVRRPRIPVAADSVYQRSRSRTRTGMAV